MRLGSSEGNAVFGILLDCFDALRQTLGHQAQDLVVLHLKLPDLDSMFDLFVSCHTHSDDEVRYVIEIVSFSRQTGIMDYRFGERVLAFYEALRRFRNHDLLNLASLPEALLKQVVIKWGAS